MAGGRGPKAKGYSGEVEIVKLGEAFDYKRSQRAWGSNGRALGWPESVDVVWEEAPDLPDLTIQVKRQKALPKWFTKAVSGPHDITVVREDRGEWYVILPLGRFLEMLRRVYRACRG